MMNKFGFDQDFAINCMSLIGVAREREAAAEAAAKARAERAEAVCSVKSMLSKFFKYFEGYNVLQYLKPSELADQAYHSLVEVNDVPVDLVEEAAKDNLVLNENDIIECALNLIIAKCNSPIVISIEE